MTLAVVITLLRSIVIAGVACWLAHRWRRNRFKGVWGIVLLAPTLMPPLLIGYAYSNTQFSLQAYPLCNEWLYSLLLVFRMMPLAWLVLFLSPAPPLSASGIYCQRLLVVSGGSFCGSSRGRGCFRGRGYFLGWWTHGPGRAMVTAMALVFLLVFGEFEIASRLGARSWTVWIFDAQVGGLSWPATLQALALPVLCQGLVFAVVVFSISNSPGSPSVSWGGGNTVGAGGTYGGVSGKRAGGFSGGWWVILSFGVVCVGPLILLGGSVVRGIFAVWSERLIFQEIGVSLLFAGVSATGVLAVISQFKTVRFGSLLLCLPGLSGSLVVGLMVLGLFQTSFLVFLYDTPLPLLVALMLVVWPVGLVLRAALASSGPATHLATRLSCSPNPAQATRGQKILWVLVHQPMVFIFCVVFYMAYIDLPASALLSPSGMSPASVRLYNLMHYGRYDTLGAMTAMTYACPWILFLIIWFIARGRKVHD